jgi:hypothetical protein
MVSTPQGLDISAVLNVIRSTSSDAYQTAVPLATASNIKDVGAAVLNAPTAIKNEFMSGLYNKIGMTLIDSPVIENEFSFLKKGTLEYGQMIEDLYVGIATAEPYVTGMIDGDTTPDPFAVRKLPSYSAFYSTILSRQYQVTRHLTDLQKAFHNGSDLAQFIAGMMNAMTSGENWDDMRATIALIARQIEESLKTDQNNKHQNTVHLITEYNAQYAPTTAVTIETCWKDKDFLTFFSNQLKKWSKRLRHVRTDSNIAGVKQTLPQSKQRIMMLEDIVVDFETNLLAWAYHGSSLSIGGVDEIDTWYSIGADGESPAVASPDDIKIKSTFSSAATGSTQCACVIYDPDMVKIFNKNRVASEQANAKGNYWNMFMSLEDIYACSPYKNFVAFMLD